MLQAPESPPPHKDKSEADNHSPDSLEDSRGRGDLKVERKEMPELILASDLGYSDNRLPSRISFETPM